jgi:hypothetical protein
MSSIDLQKELSASKSMQIVTMFNEEKDYMVRNRIALCLFDSGRYKTLRKIKKYGDDDLFKFLWSALLDRRHGSARALITLFTEKLVPFYTITDILGDSRVTEWQNTPFLKYALDIGHENCEMDVLNANIAEEFSIPWLVMINDNVQGLKTLVNYDVCLTHGYYNMIAVAGVECRLWIWNHDSSYSDEPLDISQYYSEPKIREYEMHMYILSDIATTVHFGIRQMKIFEPMLIPEIMQYVSYAATPKVMRPHQ